MVALSTQISVRRELDAGAVQDLVVQIEIANQQALIEIDQQRLSTAVRRVLADASIQQGEISIAVVDDGAIRELNRRWLGHDEATDVLSFLLEQDGDSLDGEIIVSAETALREGAGYNWTAADELLLYVIHGALHLVGHDDASEHERLAMRDRERHYLAGFGIEPHDAAVGSTDERQHALKEQGS